MRGAAYIQRKLADRPYLFILAIMTLGFVLSMFMNNVAAPVLVLAVLLPIIRDLPRESPFARCLLLSLAFSCNIGGMLTPISSPQNTVSLAALVALDPSHGISFFGWMMVRVWCWGGAGWCGESNGCKSHSHIGEKQHGQNTTQTNNQTKSPSAWICHTRDGECGASLPAFCVCMRGSGSGAFWISASFYELGLFGSVHEARRRCSRARAVV